VEHDIRLLEIATGPRALLIGENRITTAGGRKYVRRIQITV